MEPINVEGIKITGITMPETMPNKAIASLLFTPARISITGNNTAMAELIKEPPARAEVIGRVALKIGFNCFFGEESLPPNRKKQRPDAVKEKR